MQHKDETKLQETFDSFRKLHYKVRQNRIYTICSKLCLDIFIYHQIDDRLTYTNLALRNRFPNHSFYSNELFPLKKYKFGELEVYGPNEYKPYLDRQYPEWDQYAIIQQPHNYHYRLSGIEKKTKFILTPTLLKAAMPTSPLQDRTSRLGFF